MRRLWNATGLLVCLLLTALLVGPGLVQAQDADGWSQLHDGEGRLQLQDVLSARLRPLFSPLDIEDLHAPAGPGAIWLHYRLPASDAPRQLRLFSPSLDSLQLYLLHGSQLLEERQAGNLYPGQRPLLNSDILLPLRSSPEVLDLYLRLSSSQSLRPTISLESAEYPAGQQRPADVSGARMLGAQLGDAGQRRGAVGAGFHAAEESALLDDQFVLGRGGEGQWHWADCRRRGAHGGITVPRCRRRMAARLPSCCMSASAWRMSWRSAALMRWRDRASAPTECSSGA